MLEKSKKFDWILMDGVRKRKSGCYSSSVLVSVSSAYSRRSLRLRGESTLRTITARRRAQRTRREFRIRTLLLLDTFQFDVARAPGLLGEMPVLPVQLLFRKTLINVPISFASDIDQIEVTARCPDAALSYVRFVSKGNCAFRSLGKRGFVKHIYRQADTLSLQKFIDVSGAGIAYNRNSRSQVLGYFCRRRSNL